MLVMQEEIAFSDSQHFSIVRIYFDMIGSGFGYNLGLLIICTSDPSCFDGERRFGVDRDGYCGGPRALGGDFVNTDGAPADFKPSFGGPGSFCLVAKKLKTFVFRVA
ncbi:hypothetical protein FF1_023393 [Malus domestica]